MSKFGRSVILSFKQGIRDLKAGKPMTQTVVRRMTVKGKPVVTQETFKGSVK